MAKIQKVCIVTGASSGLGFETSKKMAVLGYEVVLACGDKVKAKQAISRIKQDLPDAKLIYMNLDLASFSSIAKFAKTFHNADKKLNVLVNNAAWMDKSSSRVPTFTEDGLEKTFAVNYIGHFLLTSLLLDILKSTAKFDLEARIVVISSTVVKQASKDFLSLDIDDIQLLKPGSYTGSIAYKNSKVASFLFALELHRRLEGSGVTCNIINPGKYVRSTNIFRNQGCFRKYMFPCLCLCSGTNLGRAASAVVFVATDCELSRVSGRCFVGSEESTIQIETRDLDSAKQLWDLSKGMVADVL
jgi:NAD(P)-dependent dehydrogenase (short-subunit alcohol dehydrogenase family)